jgi:hypothetical protein
MIEEAIKNLTTKKKKKKKAQGQMDLVQNSINIPQTIP